MFQDCLIIIMVNFAGNGIFIHGTTFINFCFGNIDYN